MTAITDEDRLVLIGGLRRLRRSHTYVEDCWYSCPKAPEGCCNDAYDECNCGADAHNALVDELLAVLGGGRTDLADVFEPRSPMADECIEPGDVKCSHTDVCPDCWTDASGSSQGDRP